MASLKRGKNLALWATAELFTPSVFLRFVLMISRTDAFSHNRSVHTGRVTRYIIARKLFEVASKVLVLYALVYLLSWNWLEHEWPRRLNADKRPCCFRRWATSNPNWIYVWLTVAIVELFIMCHGTLLALLLLLQKVVVEAVPGDARVSSQTWRKTDENVLFYCNA